jgi:hypothetical protein
MATVVKMGTKKADEMIHDFNRTYYKGESLYDCYNSCSKDKRESWEKIRKTCNDLQGWNLHITGASSHQYSCMYAFYNEAGNVVLRKETSANTYDLEMSREEYVDICV